jgi:hypothetical protein
VLQPAALATHIQQMLQQLQVPTQLLLPHPAAAAENLQKSSSSHLLLKHLLHQLQQ